MPCAHASTSARACTPAGYQATKHVSPCTIRSGSIGKVNAESCRILQCHGQYAYQCSINATLRCIMCLVSVRRSVTHKRHCGMSCPNLCLHQPGLPLPSIPLEMLLLQVCSPGGPAHTKSSVLLATASGIHQECNVLVLVFLETCSRPTLSLIEKVSSIDDACMQLADVSGTGA